MLLRSTDRKILNEAEIEAKLRAHTAASGWTLQVKRLQGPLPFVEQVRMYASSSVLLSYHGAQLTNSPFMPRGSVMIELFNCGHWSHTYRKFAEEAGVQMACHLCAPYPPPPTTHAAAESTRLRTVYNGLTRNV